MHCNEKFKNVLKNGIHLIHGTIKYRKLINVYFIIHIAHFIYIW